MEPPQAAEEDPLELPEYLRDIAFREIGETPEIRRAALTKLRHRIQNLPDPNDRLEDVSDVNLIRILRARKFHLGVALKTSIELQRFNQQHPELLEFDPADIMKYAPFLQIMDKRDEKQRVVITVHPVHNLPVYTDDYIANNPLGAARFTVWAMDRISRDVHAQVCGVVVLMSFHGVTFWDAVRLARVVTLDLAMLSMRYIQKCVGLRLGAAMLFEEPIFASIMFPLLRPFMAPIIRDRIHFCGEDYGRIKDVIKDVSILPELMGGKVPNDTSVRWTPTQLKLQRDELKC